MIQRAPTDVRAGTSFEAASRRLRTRVGRDKRLQTKAAGLGRAANASAGRRAKKVTRLFLRLQDLLRGLSHGHDGGRQFRRRAREPPTNADVAIVCLAERNARGIRSQGRPRRGRRRRRCAARILEFEFLSRRIAYKQSMERWRRGQRRPLARPNEPTKSYA